MCKVLLNFSHTKPSILNNYLMLQHTTEQYFLQGTKAPIHKHLHFVYLQQNVFKDSPFASVIDYAHVSLHIVKDAGIVMEAALQVEQRKVNALFWCPEMSTQQLPRKQIAGRNNIWIRMILYCVM